MIRATPIRSATRSSSVGREPGDVELGGRGRLRPASARWDETADIRRSSVSWVFMILRVMSVLDVRI